MHIGKRIAKLRRKKNYSQAGLGKGVTSGSHLSNIESGKYTPSEDILVPLSKELGVPENYLLKYGQYDRELEKLLSKYKESIVLDLDSAKKIRSQIQENYPTIYSIEQEVYFYLCESSFVLKKQNVDNALGIYNEKVEPYIKGLKLEKTLSDQLKELFFYFHGGRCFYQLRYAESLHYYRKQLPLIHNEKYKAAVLYNLSLLFFKLDQAEKAIYYSQDALDNYLKDHRWKNITKTYNLLGILYFEKGDFSSAEDCLSKGLEIAKLHKFPFLKERIYHNFGMLYEGKGDFTNSKENYSKALELKRASKSPDIDLTYRCLIDLYISVNKFDSARNMLTEALSGCFNEKELYLLKMLEAQLNLHLGNEGLYEQYMKEAIKCLYEKQQWKSLKGKSAVFADYLSANRKNKEAIHFYKLKIEIRERLDLEGSK